MNRQGPAAINNSFVSPITERFGDIRVGRGVFVASNTILRADPGRRVCIGSRTNTQDNVLVMALRDRRGVRGACARRSTDIGKRTSIAHQAEVVNSRVGDFTFIGFRARISNSVIENGAFVLHAATIRNVRIPRDRLVPVGAVITSQERANALPRKAEARRSSSARCSRSTPSSRRRTRSCTGRRASTRWSGSRAPADGVQHRPPADHRRGPGA